MPTSKLLTAQSKLTDLIFAHLEGGLWAVTKNLEKYLKREKMKLNAKGK